MQRLARRPAAQRRLAGPPPRPGHARPAGPPRVAPAAGQRDTADALGATLARVVAGRATPVVDPRATPTIQRAVSLVDPESQQTPEAIWNAFQIATMAMTEWKKQKRTYEDWLARPPRNPLLPPLKNPPVAPPQPGAQPLEAVTSWLAVHDVYAGLTETGNESWPALVRMRHGASGSQQASKFTVFTGMHGNIGGQFLDDRGMIAAAYKDTKHTKEDKDTAGKLEKELDGCKIGVIDVFDGDALRRPAALRRRVKAEVASGRVVILAWCFSAEAFKAVPDTIVADPKDDPTPDTPEKQYVSQRRRTTVQNIVADVFGADLVAGYMRPSTVVPALLEKVKALRDAMEAGAGAHELARILAEAARLWHALGSEARKACGLQLLTALNAYYVKLPSPKPNSKQAMAVALGFDGLG